MVALSNAESVMWRIKAEHRALAIIRALDREPSGRLNERIIGDFLDHLALGGHASEIRELIEKLERLGAVHSANVDGLVIVTLTKLGSDAANGRDAIDGVLRAFPDERY